MDSSPPQEDPNDPAKGGGESSTFPRFSASGILPPFAGEDATVDAERSPYSATLAEVADHFCTSAERCRIFSGFLRLRAALHNLGIVEGWQWLDGSFFERLEGREPKDIDVVTFVLPVNTPLTPEQFGQQATEAGILRPESKARYSCDAFYVDLISGPVLAIRAAVYWYGLFSHRRMTFEWKGLVEVDLAPADDAEASAILSKRQAQFELQ